MREQTEGGWREEKGREHSHRVFWHSSFGADLEPAERQTQTCDGCQDEHKQANDNKGLLRKRPS